MVKRIWRTGLMLILAAALAAPAVHAQVDGPRLPGITTPEEFLGFEIGADYQLATYDQLMAYWDQLASESNRMIVRSIGETEEGRPQYQAIITSPENQRNLEHYRQLTERLARARGLSSGEAMQLAHEGKAVVWIDGGLHATEVVGAQQLMQLVYDMVSLNDPETLRFLNDDILLATQVNPDGQALVAGWYMRNEDPMERSTSGIPVLYEKYAGHDNNRDFYMSNLAETQNINRVLYTQWYPQIVYNHHQTGPAGTVMFGPPFRDPMNWFVDPMMKTSLDQVGSAMHQRFIVEGKGGTTMRSGATYSTWWNGGLRTTPYFHNQIGLLTEIIGNPTPIEIPFIPSKQISTADLPLPVEPGVWHFKQSIDYSQTSNRAVLDYASRNKDHLLFNMWRMGMNAVEAGTRDSWTVLPFEVDSAQAAVGRAGDHDDYERLLHKPEDRDPRGFIVTADQADFQTARKFINALLMNGVEVQRATAPFTVAGKQYPAGSFVVKSDQAFAPQVMDMFLPQQHPNDFAYPGAPPTPPYDVAGWTLAFSMGVDYDAPREAFDGPFQAIDAFTIDPDPATIAGPQQAAGFLVDHRVNDAFVLVNRALKAGNDVYWMKDPVTVDGQSYPAGAFYFDGGGQRQLLEQGARDTGVPVRAVSSRPSGDSMELEPVRVGLYDQYGGSIDSGWLRFILEQFEFDYDVVYPPELDAGNLRDSYDVLIFPDGAIRSAAGGGRRFGSMPDDFASSIPEEYRDRLGSITEETTIPQIMEFGRDGGAIIAIGSSTSLAERAELPVGMQLEVNGEMPRREDYYIPGSLLSVALERSPVTTGMGDRVDVMFSNSPVFKVAPGAQGVRALAHFDSPHPLRSGWAWGQERLEGGAPFVEADLGDGKLFMFGPEVTFRGQTHATFPLVFNAIYYGAHEGGM